MRRIWVQDRSRPSLIESEIWRQSTRTWPPTRTTEFRPNDFRYSAIKVSCRHNEVDRGIVIRFTPVFRPGDDFKAWELGLKLKLTGISKASAGQTIFCLHNKEACRIFQSTQIDVSSPASVVWKAFCRMFVEPQSASVWKRRLLNSQKIPGEAADCFALKP